jgi:hypothetical protein
MAQGGSTEVISIIERIQSSRLSIKKSLSGGLGLRFEKLAVKREEAFPPLELGQLVSPNRLIQGKKVGWVWVVRVGGDDGELRPWHYIYEGRRGRWGTPTMALHIRMQHREKTG